MEIPDFLILDFKITIFIYEITRDSQQIQDLQIILTLEVRTHRFDMMRKKTIRQK